jgi:hypothetical protein
VLSFAERESFLLSIWGSICNISGRKYIVLLAFVITFFPGTLFCHDYSLTTVNSLPPLPEQDTLEKNQLLYNGRVWRNVFYRTWGDQFLFTSDFLPGSVTVSGKRFDRLQLRYDIYNDEIMIPSVEGTILQLNKERINGFTLLFENRVYEFLNMPADSLNDFCGFVNILYEGDISMFIKYRKEIDLLAVDDRFDEFFQDHEIFITMDNMQYHIKSKRSLINLFRDRKKEIRAFIRRQPRNVTVKDPDSLIPVIEYCESLSK